jgi:hypothetical protein
LGIESTRRREFAFEAAGGLTSCAPLEHAPTAEIKQFGAGTDCESGMPRA